MASIWWCTQYTRSALNLLVNDGEFNYEILIGLNCGKAYSTTTIKCTNRFVNKFLIEIFMNYSTRLITATLRQHINIHTHTTTIDALERVQRFHSSVVFFLLEIGRPRFCAIYLNTNHTFTKRSFEIFSPPSCSNAIQASNINTK